MHPTEPITSLNVGEATAEVLWHNAYIRTVEELASFETKFPGVYQVLSDGLKASNVELSVFVERAQKVVAAGAASHT